jgi:ubiquitin C-terminal hydrolase
MVVATPDGEGRWVRGKEHTVKGTFDFDPQPSQMILPPGEYGIVKLACHQGNRQHHYISKVAERGSIWDGSCQV